MGISQNPQSSQSRLYTFSMQDTSEWPPEYKAVFAKASEVRSQRDALKTGINSGNLLLREVLNQADAEKAIADIKLLSLMDCVPQLGKVRGRRLLGNLGWAETVKLGELASEQQEELLSRLADHGCRV